MADPRIEAFKRFALQQAVMQPPDANVPSMPNALPNLGTPLQVPQVTAPQPVQQQPGPIKSFLQNFIYGSGQGLLAKAGLETDAEKQQRMFNQQQATQNATAQNQLRQAQMQALNSQNEQEDLSQYGIPNLTGTAARKDVPKIITAHIQGLSRENTATTRAEASRDVANTNADSAYDINKLKYGDGEIPGPANTTIKDIAGHSFLLNKRTGEKLRDLGQSNSVATAQARAQAMAQYRIVPTIDDEGNPTVTSAVQALKGGNPSVPFTQSRALTSDRVGIQQYEDILTKKIVPSLSVLNDNVQRGIIAETLKRADENPGAFQAIITSAAQNDGLSPQGAALTAGILQSREFGPVARKYGGNMNGTEGLTKRIMANQASPLNSEQLNRELIQNDLEFTSKAKRALGGLTKRGVHTGNAPASSAAPAKATHRFNPATGQIEVIP